MTKPYYQDGPVTLFHGDCIEVMRTMPDASVHAVITDPPYGLEFMGKDWDGADGFRRSLNAADAGRESVFGRTSKRAPEYNTGRGSRVAQERAAELTAKGKGHTTSAGPYLAAGVDSIRVAGLPFQEWCTVWAAECLRVLKPGGYMLAFGGSRTWHRLTVAVEDAGFEIRDTIAWLYGSGFAKSWNFATQYKGEWCTCGGGNAVPYNHASNSEMRGLWEDVHKTPVPRGKGENASVLAEVQRGAAGRGVEDSRAQGAGGVVAGNGSGIRGLDSGRDEPVMEGRLVHRAGQGLPDDSESQPSEGASERVRGGASASDGGNDRASGDSARGSASQESAEDGQPTGESDSVPGSHDALDDGALRGRPVCPRCGGLREEYRGYGSALKPSFEPIVVGRKPLAGTIAANVLAHGTGALNIDATRVPMSDEDAAAIRSMTGFGVDGYTRPRTDETFMQGTPTATAASAHAAGRWPTNVLLDGCQADELDRQSGVTKDGVAVKRNRDGKVQGSSSWTLPGAPRPDAGYGGEGGASRFFPTFRYEAKAPGSERPDVDGVQHPTVKPLALMQWLVRLVTPPGGTVLEPFAGSGTTLEAGLMEGISVIGIEREADYLPLIMSRLQSPIEQTLFGGIA